MRAYEALNLPLTRCVHFVKNQEFEGTQHSVVQAALKEGVTFVYWSYLESGSESITIADPLGIALKLEHAPYGTSWVNGISWVRFLDGLITLAYRYKGLVIIIDHADVLLRERPDDMFDLIESFLTQFHHWYDQKKPCHLCLQMEKNPSVRRSFAPEAEA
jgi:hypothetical protein